MNDYTVAPGAAVNSVSFQEPHSGAELLCCPCSAPMGSLLSVAHGPQCSALMPPIPLKLPRSQFSKGLGIFPASCGTNVGAKARWGTGTVAPEPSGTAEPCGCRGTGGLGSTAGVARTGVCCHG